MIDKMERKQSAETALRDATTDDLDELVALEQACFQHDQISRRQFRWMIKRANARLQVAEGKSGLSGYILLLFHNGTSLARLYSIAVAEAARGTGLGSQMLVEAERLALERQCVYLRLEVNPQNKAAIRLYESRDYRPFGLIRDYYQDHGDAVRYQKRIMIMPTAVSHLVPYYEQTLDFSCGPACLIMAMQALAPEFSGDRSLEIQLWREATTVYMTSGHGGCSPQGLALAAARRKFSVTLWLSDRNPLFLDGVRKPEKKSVLELVHNDFMAEIEDRDIEIVTGGFTVQALVDALSRGEIPLVLISSWRFNNSKAPHWIVLAAADETFVYLHDPDVDTKLSKAPGDTQSVPVKLSDFAKMIHFGQARAQAALCLSQPLKRKKNQG
jgi:ribosomal protein S18 acetylase RimI-like enzyme